ncbi:hypothetical protein [Sphingomonas gilva]|uniref:hypothetical protein n=1 Tax=Sphingomonas gilva TaxID=2305907 RepID=UPI001FE520FB|nr:hypothetical protein [Sphingomonas gilva]
MRDDIGTVENAGERVEEGRRPDQRERRGVFGRGAPQGEVRRQPTISSGLKK